ncbi:Enoyl-CoA hydratase domain-containing protein 3, mitochondrial [Tupaia chinensis]|uniref:Enoyl-CoA hydratase domain-containing protein 3, mitochondrial n=1 Tax=Tupaia chinensis TaxID=246437 RepID=L9KRA0_TUPCH|nr:Enoyl-CoA hydratase domain-containing protein 3, mitochondrial [Tupaia chinensis]
MAAIAGFRTVGAKRPGWLLRGLWDSLPARFCSREPARVARPEPEAPRQGDGISRILSNRKQSVEGSQHCQIPLAPATVEQNLRPLCLGGDDFGTAVTCPFCGGGSHVSDSKCGGEGETNQGKEGGKSAYVSAEGPVFSSGHDLKELTEEQGHDYHAEVFHTCSEVMMLIQNHPVPVIAMVNGLATAAGCQLVASCDIAVASDKSSFATPGVNVGLFCSTPGVALGTAVPSKVALEMLFTGEPISAQEALLHGLLSKVVPEEQLEEETMRIATKIASLSRPVVSLGKATFYKQLTQDLRTAYCLTSQSMVNNLALPDGQEGIKAFIQKRKPNWSQ